MFGICIELYVQVIVYAMFLNIIYDILAQTDHLRQVAAKPCSSLQDAFNDEDIHFSPIFLAPFMFRGHILHGVEEMVVGYAIIFRTVLLLRWILSGTFDEIRNEE